MRQQGFHRWAACERMESSRRLCGYSTGAWCPSRSRSFDQHCLHSSFLQMATRLWKFEATFKPGSALFMRCRAQADAFRRREETAVPYILICAQHARIHASAQLHGHVQGNEGGRCCYAAAYTQCNVQHTAVSNMLAAISSSGYYGLSVPRSTPAHGIIPLASELEPAKPRAASDPAQPPVQPPAQRHQARADRTRPSYPISYPILSYAIALSVDMGDLFLSYFKPQTGRPDDHTGLLSQR